MRYGCIVKNSLILLINHLEDIVVVIEKVKELRSVSELVIVNVPHLLEL